MSTQAALHGLSCPRCGGMVPIPEGQVVVICPFCDLRSGVSGERGVRRYQVPTQTGREQALDAYQSFLKGNLAIAGSVSRQARLDEAFLVHLPFWAAWGRALGWAFGEKQVGSGDDKRYEPREVRVAEDMTWNAAACDVGEFGVTNINLSGRPLEPFESDSLHASGMVFEPTGSAQESLETARRVFEEQVRRKTRLDRISQTFVRIVRPRLGLVYYPLWVLRYLYRERAFQVVVDGYTGEVLYGKAPGSVWFRSAVLVGGMMAGSVLAVTIPGTILLNSGDEDVLGIAAGLFVGGLVLMFASWRKYRYGEHYEYRRYKQATESFFKIPGSAGELIEIARSLEKLR
jgi:hypothetical protein